LAFVNKIESELGSTRCIANRIWRFVDDLAKNLRVIAPNERERNQSGQIRNRIVATKGYDINKTRELHFAVLIALTARRIGAYLITCNIDDFTAIHETLFSTLFASSDLAKASLN
jgi:predicted nucleic acid-binding protein